MDRPMEIARVHIKRLIYSVAKGGGSLTDYTQDEKALKGECDCTQGRLLYLFGWLLL